MEKRKLGNSGLEVAPLAFGGNVFGWTLDEPTSFKLLDAFVAAGFNLIDTADVYSRWVEGNSGGESETIIGKWLKRSGSRSKVVIASKVGKEMGPSSKGLSKTYILKAVEDSLRRLQTDYIDLYQSHADDPDTPLEETSDRERSGPSVHPTMVPSVSLKPWQSASKAASHDTSVCSPYTIFTIVPIMKKSSSRFAGKRDWV